MYPLVRLLVPHHKSSLLSAQASRFVGEKIGYPILTILENVLSQVPLVNTNGHYLQPTWLQKGTHILRWSSKSMTTTTTTTTAPDGFLLHSPPPNNVSSESITCQSDRDEQPWCFAVSPPLSSLNKRNLSDFSIQKLYLKICSWNQTPSELSLGGLHLVQMWNDGPHCLTVTLCLWFFGRKKGWYNTHTHTNSGVILMLNTHDHLCGNL